VLASSKLGVAIRQRLVRMAVHIGPVRRLVANQLTGVGIHYPRPAGAHRLVGQRYPHTGAGTQPVYDALRTGTFVLVRRDGAQGGGTGTEHVTTVHLPAQAAEPSTVLIRPDGYIAWASDRPSAAALASALEHWCGARAPRAS
jgi:hypothetical protein